ncbi:MAG: translation elongation factor Ts [Candidatus Sungbacteria bacterium]|uniref:Elongation factor Ts n=1 Tax=Candidatus Sungiibacteriota bacterium TaxID=2750080 RepID=A0A932DS13_9BACT|nr:translation elongation factor Ts [Candidatus Sungbacteria bacterium]MBI2465691.1 translation elongation factor Ts [Candidatus Sungbacteria bacterium]
MGLISSLEVKKLRELTGASMMDCKRALESAGGDFDKAQHYLKEQGFKIAEKKSARSTSAGLVEPYVHSDGRSGALVELMCETDFVARNPVFKELAHDLAMQVVATDPDDEPGFLAAPFIKNPDETVGEYIHSKVALLGENIKLGRFVKFQI